MKCGKLSVAEVPEVWNTILTIRNRVVTCLKDGDAVGDDDNEAAPVRQHENGTHDGQRLEDVGLEVGGSKALGTRITCLLVLLLHLSIF